MLISYFIDRNCYLKNNINLFKIKKNKKQHKLIGFKPDEL